MATSSSRCRPSATSLHQSPNPNPSPNPSRNRRRPSPTASRFRRRGCSASRAPVRWWAARWRAARSAACTAICPSPRVEGARRGREGLLRRGHRVLRVAHRGDRLLARANVRQGARRRPGIGGAGGRRRGERGAHRGLVGQRGSGGGERGIDLLLRGEHRLLVRRELRIGDRGAEHDASRPRPRSGMTSRWPTRRSGSSWRRRTRCRPSRSTRSTRSSRRRSRRRSHRPGPSTA